MLTFLWTHRVRAIPLAFLLVYESILVSVAAGFDAHMITVTLVAASFFSWPDGTPANESIIGLHTLPEPWDFVMAIVFLLLPGVLMLAGAIL